MGDAQSFIEQELAGERASAHGRAFEALERALAELAAAAVPRGDLLEEACERLWFLVVQREAMGIARHDVLFDVLRVPPEVRRGMGPRRGR